LSWLSKRNSSRASRSGPPRNAERLRHRPAGDRIRHRELARPAVARGDRRARRHGIDTLQKLFTRWAGFVAQAFLQAITLDRARALLEQSATVLDTTYEVGLSGPGRLHDLFVTHER